MNKDVDTAINRMAILSISNGVLVLLIVVTVIHIMAYQLGEVWHWVFLLVAAAIAVGDCIFIWSYKDDLFRTFEEDIE